MSGRVEESVWEERREWVRRQRESEVSVARFCRDNGLHEGNFYSWRRRFAMADSGSVIAGNLPSGRRALQAFVQLPLPTVAVASSGPSWIEVSLADGMVVRVPASNLAALEAVLSSLNRSAQESRHA